MGLSGPSQAAGWRFIMAAILADTNWSAVLQQSDALTIVLIPVCLTAILLGSVIAVQWRKVRQAECDAHLKEQMIARGFTAEEIVSVIDAGGGPSRSDRGGCRSVGQSPPDHDGLETNSEQLGCCR
jgi:hypothetical protein